MAENIFNGGGVRIGSNGEKSGAFYTELKEVRYQPPSHPPYLDAPANTNQNPYGTAQPYSPYANQIERGSSRPPKPQQSPNESASRPLYLSYGPKYPDNSNQVPVLESSINRAQFNDEMYLQQDPHYKDATPLKKLYIRYYELQPPNVKLMIVCVIVLWFIVSIMIIKEF